MTEQELRKLLDELRKLPHETEWVEFKESNYKHDEIGQYISALSNAASLHGHAHGYLVFGIEDLSHNIVGTSFKPKTEKHGSEELENWLARGLSPRIDFKIYEVVYESKPVVILKLDAAHERPVKFQSKGFIRVGSYKKPLSEHPEKERKLWQKSPAVDWSAQVCERVTINDLDPNAIKRARAEYIQKHPKIRDEVIQWDDITFLNKTKIARDGQITRTAIILLGKEESAHHLSPSVAQLTWILKDDKNMEQDYAHFGPPLLLHIEDIFARIRNITIRHLPDGTLFPKEITQYDPWVIREALHNAIAHQDYELKGRVNVVETPDMLIFTNQGSFIPGSVEAVIKQDAPAAVYRNPFLAQAMVELNMIDTIGSGIKRMFEAQRKRYFPLPDFDLTETNRVSVSIPGKILDKNYTQLLIEKTDLDLSTVMLLDRVQKKFSIIKEQAELLRRQRLIEGRYPNIFIASHVASLAGQKAAYIKQRGFDEDYYIKLVVEYLQKFGHATRKDIDNLLMDKLPDILDPQQKIEKINKLLSAKMCKKRQLIKNVGSRRLPKWELANGVKNN